MALIHGGRCPSCPQRAQPQTEELIPELAVMLARVIPAGPLAWSLVDLLYGGIVS
jgi:hypothetical protein